MQQGSDLAWQGCALGQSCGPVAKLVFTTPEFAGQGFELPEGKTTVGRAPGNTLVIEAPSVSAQHCQILVYGSEVIVRDEGSTNGTWVNQSRVRGQTAVQNGQTIRFGSVEARLELPAQKEEEDQTEHTAIYLHARAQRDARRAERQRPAASSSASPTIIRPRADEGSAR
jgi:hypothetical protein